MDYNCDKNFKKLITKCDGITNRDGLQSDTEHGVQSTKVICCNRFSFLLSIYDVNIFNDRINILEYPEFAVIKKEFRFTMEMFYLGVNNFK